MLIFFRILQGAGGGGLQPSEQAILADTFPPAKRGMAFAVYGLAVVLAPAIGPTLGGWITTTFTWRWIFSAEYSCRHTFAGVDFASHPGPAIPQAPRSCLKPRSITLVSAW